MGEGKVRKSNKTAVEQVISLMMRMRINIEHAANTDDV
jgi:hypothetical protein